jgi:cell division septation protein DedD
MELQRILGEAQATHRQMQDVAVAAPDKPTREIVRLRTRFATLLAEMMGAVKTDAGLQRAPGVAEEFESRFAAMRQSLAAHQAQWRSEAIDADPAGYRQAAEALGREQDAFYAWAREALPG